MSKQSVSTTGEKAHLAVVQKGKARAPATFWIQRGLKADLVGGEFVVLADDSLKASRFFNGERLAAPCW